MGKRLLVLLGLSVGCGGAIPEPATPDARIGEATWAVRCAVNESAVIEGSHAAVVGDECLGSASEIVETVRRLKVAAARGTDPTSVFTGDGEFVAARGAAPSAHDVTLDAGAAYRRWRALHELYGGPAGEADFTNGFQAVEVQATGDEARLRGTHLDLHGHGESLNTSGVEATLRRVDGVWRVARFRIWPVEYASIDGGRVYDDAYWSETERRLAAARVALGRAPTAEARRALVERLFEARHLGEILGALQPLLDGAPTVDDLAASARIHALHGRLEEARAADARARAPGTPIRTLATYLRRRGCTAPREPVLDEEAYDDPRSHCEFEVIADLRDETGGLSAVGVVRTITGPEAAEAIELLGHNGRWFPARTLAEGPFLGNQTEGVTSIGITEVELVELDGTGPRELRMRYTRERIDEDGETRDAGFVLCALGGPRARCGFVPSEVVHDGGGRPRTTAYAITFEGNGVRVRRRRGPRREGVPEGTLPLSELLTEE